MDLLAQELNEERQRRQELQQDYQDYKSLWEEEPLYENEHSPMFAGGEQRQGMSDVTFPALSVSTLPDVSAGPSRAPIDPMFSDVHPQQSAVQSGMSFGASLQ